MKSFKKIPLVMFFLSLMVGIALVGCSKTEPTISSSTGETYDLALCFASEPQTIDPTLNITVDGSVMIQHFFEGLMKWGDAGTPANSKGNVNDAKLVNGQASSYEKNS